MHCCQLANSKSGNAQNTIVASILFSVRHNLPMNCVKLLTSGSCLADPLMGVNKKKMQDFSLAISVGTTGGLTALEWATTHSKNAIMLLELKILSVVPSGLSLVDLESTLIRVCGVCVRTQVLADQTLPMIEKIPVQRL